MGFLNKVGSFFKREAKDLGDAAEAVKGKLDAELSEREAQLTMTPSEKILALQREAVANDERIDEIVDRATAQEAKADAIAELDAIDTQAELPAVTRIVLADGRVKSGDDMPAPVVDPDGQVREVPVVTAPSPEDLKTPIQTADQAYADVLAPVVDPAEDVPESPEVAVAAATIDTATADAAASADNADTEDADPDDPDPDDADNDDPDPEDSPGAGIDTSSPDYGKTPAQIKYEEARAAANDLLDELRGELTDEGEI